MSLKQFSTESESRVNTKKVMSRLTLQPSSSILRNAAPKISAILNSFTTNHSHEQQQRKREWCHQLPEDVETSAKEEMKERWQTPHFPILTSRQLEMSLREIDRRERLKREKQQQQQQQVEVKKSADSNNDPSSVQSIVDSSISNEETASSSSSRDSNREAAILIPLCTVQGKLSILFTRRSATLSTHASQISFPGGYYDEELDDGTNKSDTIDNEQQQRLINTALRETQEELCYNIHQLPTSSLITILGQTQPVPSMTGSKVTPIIATLNYDLPHHTTIEFNTMFPGNSDEVDWIFTVTIEELLKGEGSEVLERWSGSEYGHKKDVDDVKKTKQEEYDDGDDDDIEKKRRRRKEVMGPVFHIPECEKKRDGDKIWGLTAIVLRPLLRKVFKPVFFGNNTDDCLVDDGIRVHNAKL